MRKKKKDYKEKAKKWGRGWFLHLTSLWPSSESESRRRLLETLTQQRKVPKMMDRLKPWFLGAAVWEGSLLSLLNVITIQLGYLQCILSFVPKCVWRRMLFVRMELRPGVVCFSTIYLRLFFFFSIRTWINDDLHSINKPREVSEFLTSPKIFFFMCKKMQFSFKKKFFFINKASYCDGCSSCLKKSSLLIRLNLFPPYTPPPKNYS